VDGLYHLSIDRILDGEEWIEWWKHIPLVAKFITYGYDFEGSFVNNTRGRKYEAVDIHAHFLRHADWDGMVALGPARAVSDYVRIMLRRDKCEGEKTKKQEPSRAHTVYVNRVRNAMWIIYKAYAAHRYHPSRVFDPSASDHLNTITDPFFDSQVKSSRRGYCTMSARLKSSP
jgi:hypothetical protein